MPKPTLYELASAMLETTNPFTQSLSEMEYRDSHGSTISFLGLLQANLGNKKQSIDTRRGDAINHTACIKAIAETIGDYLYSFPAPYSYKQRLKQIFNGWIEELQTKYCCTLEPDLYPEELKTEIDEGATVVALVKSLHDARGVSKEQLSERLGITERAIQKDLRKLDPELYKGDIQATGSAYIPFRLGGQPVQVPIKAFQKEHDKKNYYRTPNTLHPIILQENLMQAGVLVQSLYRNFADHGSDTSRSIAIDIWYQLSRYARYRVKKYFGANDEAFAQFLDDIENEFPDGHLAGYRTERSLITELGNTSIDEFLLYVAKGAGRRCDIILEIDGQEKELTDVRVVLNGQGDRLTYKAVARDGAEVYFDYEDLIDILPR